MHRNLTAKIDDIALEMIDQTKESEIIREKLLDKPEINIFPILSKYLRVSLWLYCDRKGCVVSLGFQGHISPP